MADDLRWHLRVNGEPACSCKVLLDDRRLPLTTGFCSSYSRERVDAIAADVRRLYPHLQVEVTQDGCHDGVF